MVSIQLCADCLGTRLNHTWHIYITVCSSTAAIKQAAYNWSVLHFYVGVQLWHLTTGNRGDVFEREAATHALHILYNYANRTS